MSKVTKYNSFYYNYFLFRASIIKGAYFLIRTQSYYLELMGVLKRHLSIE